MNKGNVIDLAVYRKEAEMNNNTRDPSHEDLASAIESLIKRLRNSEPLKSAV